MGQAGRLGVTGDPRERPLLFLRCGRARRDASRQGAGGSVGDETDNYLPYRVEFTDLGREHPVTAGLADVSDLYVETLNPEQPTQTRTPDGWRTGRSRIERIEVRGGEPVEEHVLETRHGPVISPVVPGESRVLALRCTGLEPGDPLGPVLDLCRATNVEAFDDAVSRRPGVTFNYIYAHRAGRIGYRMSGSIPRRAQGEEIGRAHV
mgnify:CR=1 FL=1